MPASLSLLGSLNVDLNGIGFTGGALDASGEHFAVTSYVPEDVLITQVAIRQNVAVGTPPVYRVGIEGQDSTGFPDGALKAAGASVLWTPSSADDNTLKWLTLDTPYPAGAGELISIVCRYSSGTINASNHINIYYRTVNTTAEGVPYTTIFTSTREARFAPFAYRSATRVYGRPIASMGQHTWDSADLKGAKFRIPANRGYDELTLAGFRWVVRRVTGLTQTFTLFDASDNIMELITWDSESAVANATWCTFMFLSPPRIKVGEFYRLVQTSSTSLDDTAGASFINCADEDERKAFDPWEFDCMRTERPSAGGAWTDYPERRPAVEFFINEFYPRIGPGRNVNRGV